MPQIFLIKRFWKIQQIGIYKHHSVYTNASYHPYSGQLTSSHFYTTEH